MILASGGWGRGYHVSLDREAAFLSARCASCDMMLCSRSSSFCSSRKQKSREKDGLALRWVEVEAAVCNAEQEAFEEGLRDLVGAADGTVIEEEGRDVRVTGRGPLYGSLETDR